MLYLCEETWREGNEDGFWGWANVIFKPFKLYDFSIWLKYFEQVEFIPRNLESSNKEAALELNEKHKSKSAIVFKKYLLKVII